MVAVTVTWLYRITTYLTEVVFKLAYALPNTSHLNGIIKDFK